MITDRQTKFALRLAEQEQYIFLKKNVNGLEFAKELLKHNWTVDIYKKGISYGYKAVKDDSKININSNIAHTMLFYMQNFTEDTKTK
jgi:hypothetical protein